MLSRSIAIVGYSCFFPLLPCNCPLWNSTVLPDMFIFPIFYSWIMLLSSLLDLSCCARPYHRHVPRNEIPACRVFKNSPMREDMKLFSKTASSLPERSIWEFPLFHIFFQQSYKIISLGSCQLSVFVIYYFKMESPTNLLHPARDFSNSLAFQPSLNLPWKGLLVL